ncbi:hypothetical protein BGX29_003451 [Mortierella sp. GBA35]|nr:hypothetical protein BGX29_003451 [Mortierella sp. GBA35]
MGTSLLTEQPLLGDYSDTATNPTVSSETNVIPTAVNNTTATVSIVSNDKNTILASNNSTPSTPIDNTIAPGDITASASNDKQRTTLSDLPFESISLMVVPLQRKDVHSCVLFSRSLSQSFIPHLRRSIDTSFCYQSTPQLDHVEWIRQVKALLIDSGALSRNGVSSTRSRVFTWSGWMCCPRSLPQFGGGRH